MNRNELAEKLDAWRYGQKKGNYNVSCFDMADSILLAFEQIVKECKPDSTKWCGDECVDIAIDTYESNLLSQLKGNI